MAKHLLPMVAAFLGLAVATCDGGGGGGAGPEDSGDGYLSDGILIDNDARGPDGTPGDLPGPDREAGDGSAPDSPCIPACEGLACGDDGCGGTCGTCPFGKECQEGLCIVPVNCGDGQCVEGETCTDCPVDCGKCPACGDGECNGMESCFDCPADCGDCCGDGACVADHGEDCLSCAADCGDCCGDDQCVAEHGEDCLACKEDCGLCCGDGACVGDHGEDCDACEADCGPCCGDGACVDVHGETCASCEVDCGPCPECGDGACNGVETCLSCPGDCPCAAGAICFEGFCCIPDCTGIVCGSDGCGGSCGACPQGEGCSAGACIPAGEDSCLELYECRIQCPAGDSDCVKACDEEGTVAAQEAYAAWVACLEGTGYFDCPEDDDACYDAAFEPCEDLVQACLQGEGSCGEIFDCQQACPGGDGTCTSLCLFNGTVAGQDLLEDLFDCVDVQCPDGATWECWIQATAGACKVPAALCWSEPCESLCDQLQCGYGNCNDHCGFCAQGFVCSPEQQCVASQGFDCLAIYECIVACPEGDAACPPFCFSQGTDEAKTQYNAWLDCLELGGYFDCPPGDTVCRDLVFESCMDLVQACLHGELTCGEMFDCMQLDCPAGDADCANLCFWNGAIAMQESYEQMMDCFAAACPGGLTYTCIETSLQGACAAWASTCWSGCVSGCDLGTHCLYGGCGEWCDVTCSTGLQCNVSTGLCE
ncbi:MAG: hypothetical protein FJ098_00440 [Deltaproteobacteria bacterium]|nr:hypothetical protein [Deltaproteobacteria bacterium]